MLSQCIAHPQAAAGPDRVRPEDGGGPRAVHGHQLHLHPPGRRAAAGVRHRIDILQYSASVFLLSTYTPQPGKFNAVKSYPEP